MNKKIAITLLVVLAVFAITGCADRPPRNEVHTLDDINGRVIGAMRGTPSERLADELGTARSFNSTDELIFHLLTGTLDCIIMDATVAAELLESHSGIRALNEPLLVYDMRFAIALENAGLLSAVNSALETLRGNGTLRGLSGRHFAGRPFTYVPPEGIEQRPGYLSVAVSADSPPFSFRNEAGYIMGLDIDVARAVCDLLGIELRVIEYDSWELVRAVRYGRADMAVGWLPDEADEETINISEPYAVAEHLVLVRR